MYATWRLFLIHDSLAVLFMGVNSYCQDSSNVDSLSLSGHISIELRNNSSIEVPVWSHYYDYGCANFMDGICSKPIEGLFFEFFDEENIKLQDKRNVWLSFDLPKKRCWVRWIR
jgi:hypothetical protein